MKKTINYIIKRIIIGIGIAISLMLIRHNLLIGVSAETLNQAPNIIIITGASVNSYPAVSLTYNNETVYSVSENVQLQGGYKYNWFYQYSNFNNSTYCSTTNNNGNISGTIYALGFPFVGSTNAVKIEDTTHSGTYDPCTYSINGGTMKFTCTNVNLSHTLNIVGSQFSTLSLNTSEYTSDRYGISNLTISCSMTDEALADIIVNNNNQNTQNIINNQNENTDKEIESQKVCKIYNKNYVITNPNYALNSSGIVVSTSSNTGVTDYIRIIGSTIKVLATSGGNSCFYDTDKTLISCATSNSVGLNNYYTIPTKAVYFRSTIGLSSDTPRFEICTNGNQAIADGQQQINDSLNDDTGVSNNDIESLFGEFEESDSPISDLLTMPITLLNAYISGMNGTCQSISLGQLYGSNLIIPCINLEERLGSSLWNTIDILFSLFMIYNISQLFITAFDGLTSLKDSFDWLYGVEGRHVATGTRMDRYGD